MKNAKKLLPWIPEIYLMVSVIYYASLTPNLFLNPIAIGLLAILLLHIILKNKIFGAIISSLFCILNLFMCLALISELREFPSFDDQAKQMVIFGSVYLGTNIMMSTWMFFKWVIPIFSPNDNMIKPSLQQV